MVICIHHNKDLDGYASGAVVRRKFPDCQLIGWDYGMPIPDIPEGNDVVMIDISFSMEKMAEIRKKSKSLTWIDHHISAFKEWTNVAAKDPYLMGIKYVYEPGVAACEIGWKHYFPDEEIPRAVELLGKYDTWRGNGTDEWEEFILPFQYGMRQICTDPITFPSELLEGGTDYEVGGRIVPIIEKGEAILSYQRQQDMLKCERGAFEKEVYGGLKGLCLNEGVFSSETMITHPQYDECDILIGFVYNKDFWRVSLRTLKDDVDVSLIAKQRGGGGHRKAAGFEVKTFEEIFK